MVVSKPLKPLATKRGTAKVQWIFFAEERIKERFEIYLLTFKTLSKYIL